MPDPTFAEQMVTKLQEQLLARQPFLNCTVDGQTVTQESLTALQTSLQYWEKRVAREQGSRKGIRTILLGE